MAEQQIDEKALPRGVPLAPPRWVDPYCGIPFREEPEAKDGVNCWTLVRRVMHEQLGIHLERYGEISAGNLMACARAFAEGRESYGDFIEIPREARDRVRAYDLVLMRIFERERGSHKFPAHIGIMVNTGFMLHAQEKSLSCCVRIDQHDIWPRVISFHRHRALET